jgi:large subunit ribosomal protein L23
MNKIIGPVISEKSMSDASKGRYTFKVAKQATKKEIKKEVEEKFKVNVLKTATISIKGRSSKKGTKRLEITLSPFKKAIVLLKEGQKISIFDAGAKE